MTSLGTYDCEPTLTDSQVLEFCRNGYLMFEGVVPTEINRRTTEYTAVHDGTEPSGILMKDWFVEHVLCNREAVGAVRSLLGANLHLPVLMSNHRRIGPRHVHAGWHVDGGSKFSHELHDLQVFYYPQDTPIELGPTEILPGSHFLRNQQRYMAHLENIRDAVMTTAPAGSIFITVYHIWHRAVPLYCEGVRDMLKYVYWRTTPPERDWIHDPDFDFAHANYEGNLPLQAAVEQFQLSRDTAKFFYWLCGMENRFQVVGGQSWPMPGNRIGLPYGFPGPESSE